jgi:hypothetical protein
VVRQVQDPLTGEPKYRPDHTFRLEPLTRSNEVATGLAASIHDPAWLLTRQWQFGEFAGQDAGSPVLVTLAGRSERIAGWRPRPEEEPAPGWRPYRVRQGPLDVRVEAEPGRQDDLRTRLDGGLHLSRMLGEAGRDAALRAVLEECGFEDSDEGLAEAPALVRLLAAGTPDAGRVAARLADGGVGPAAARSVLDAWLAWWREQFGGAGPGAFNEHRFEHRFELACGDAVLRADEHLGGSLDWYAVDGVPLEGAPADAAEAYQFSQEALPSPVRYGGLPADRFWEMEDAQIDLASAEVSTLDLGRLLLIGFAEVYGNDWFLVPLEVPLGSLTTVRRLVVSDSFGDRWLVERAGSAESGWNMFAVTGADGLLVLPSAPGQVGPVLETVVLARDELANTAWAIEHSHTDGADRLVDRQDAWAAKRPDPAEPGALPAYAVQTIVPDYWVPLMPVAHVADSIRFRLTSLLQPPDLDAVAKGRLLTMDQWVHEEEVPREGAVLTRRHVLARWHDGSWHSWTRREKNAGSGESSSGLAFDIVRPSDPWP